MLSTPWKRLLLQAVFIILAVLLSVFTVTLILEKSLVKQALELEADAFINSFRVDKDFPLPRTRNLIGYLSKPGEPVNLTEDLLALQPGLHVNTKVGDRKEPVPVYVRDFDQHRLYLLFEGANIDRLVGVFGLVPLSIFLIIIYTSSWIAYKLSWRAMSPVLKIARDVRRINPENLSLKFSSKDLSGETKELVEALDEYAKRIDDFVDRERQFTADVSHELRTPMTIIDGAAQFIEKDTEISAKSHERVKMIRRACQDVNELTSAFFLLARDQNLNQNQQPINVAKIVENEVIKQLSLVDESKVKINLDIQSRLEVSTNQKALEIIIANIFGNAVKYTEAGHINISVTNSQVIISDTGIGIPEEILPHLFKRHIRGRGLQQAGEGIGLAIVKRLCDQFNWDISIKNRNQSGVLVTLTMKQDN